MSATNQYINDNFAIFIDGRCVKYDFDIHINDWIVYPNGSYIDFGIRIYNVSNASFLYVYVPYEIVIEEIEDLAPLFCDEKITRVITNAATGITTSTTSPIIELIYNKNKESVISFSALNLQIEKCDNGTLIRFLLENAHPIIKYDNAYIRFRIPHKSLDRIFVAKRHNLKFSFDSPIITDNYQHTIKINEFRSLPIAIRKVLPDHEQNIEEVHFYLVASDIINTSENICENIRPLENDLFGSYTPKTFKSKNVFIYHWVKRFNKHFYFNFRFSISRLKILSLIIYSLIIIFLTIIGNILWELLKLLPLFNSNFPR